jgi:alpha-glucosidase
MQMNGLQFIRGLTVRGSGRVDYHLQGDWQTLRVEAGIDDRNKNIAEVRFQILGDDRLLYDSGLVKERSIAKLEVDIRGITILGLRTVSSNGSVTTNWANPTISGFSGDKVGN